MKIRLTPILALLIVLGTAFAVTGYHMVYRYPGFTPDPAPRPKQLTLVSGAQIKARGAYLKRDRDPVFRAYQPDAAIQISGPDDASGLTVELENIHPDAVFSITGSNSGKVSETHKGLLRKVIITDLAPTETLTLSWQFPKKSRYRFVAIGDTGADRELDWSLIRAAQLGADFILNLGDLYYDESELGDVAAHFNRARVPVYVANGNHDFRGPSGNSIELFLQNIGPMNADFSLLGHCFINLDTGAFMFPPDRGERAALLNAAIVNKRHAPGRCSEHIVFTHKPMVAEFEAEFPDRKHALHGRDARSLIRQLQQLGPVTLLAGHIHQDFSFHQDGIQTWVAGGGLAQADLEQKGFRARVLVGEIERGQPLKLEWALNKMPLEYHCSKRLLRALKRDENPLADKIAASCVHRDDARGDASY